MSSEEIQLSTNGSSDADHAPHQDKLPAEIDVLLLAEKVYRLMQGELRLEKVRGERPIGVGGRRWAG